MAPLKTIAVWSLAEHHSLPTLGTAAQHTAARAFESIAADEVNDGADGPPPPAPPRSGKIKRRARRVLQQPVADSPAWR